MADDLSTDTSTEPEVSASDDTSDVSASDDTDKPDAPAVSKYKFKRGEKEFEHSPEELAAMLNDDFDAEIATWILVHLKSD